MVGRGLRLPYGERTGDNDVDSVWLTAHDKFEDIIAEAQRGDSIFKAGNIIKVEDIEPEEETTAQLSLPNAEPNQILDSAYEATGIDRTEQTDTAIQAIHENIRQEVYQAIQHTPEHAVTAEKVKEIAKKAVSTVTEQKDYAQTFRENAVPEIIRWTEQEVEKVHRSIYCLLYALAMSADTLVSAKSSVCIHL